MDIDLIIVTTASIVNIALASIILIHRSKKTATAAWIFVGSVAALVLWSMSNFLADSVLDVHTALTWTRLTFPASVVMLFFITWFSYAFPKPIPRQKYTLYVLGTLSLLSALVSMTSHVVTHITILPAGGVHDVVLGALYIPTMVLYLTLIILTIRNFIVQMRTSVGIEKMQILYVVTGWAFFLSAAALTNLILPYITDTASLSRFGPLFSVVMVAAVAYAIIKHQFLDIRIIIQRGLVYTALFSIIIGFYLSLLFVAGLVLEHITGVTTIFTAVVTILLGIFVVPKIDQFLRRITDTVFLKIDTTTMKHSRNLVK